MNSEIEPIPNLNGILDSDSGYRSQPPQPSDLAAVAVGAVGPGALAAAESSLEVSNQGDSMSAALTDQEIEILSALVRRAGGVNSLIRWLQIHPALVSETE